MKNSDKIILDLCGGTGSWSRPYAEAGYDVRVITLPEWDVNNTQTLFAVDNIIFQNPKSRRKKFMCIERSKIHGILAAPPCTMFSFARTNAKTPRSLQEGMACVKSCLRIIWFCNEVIQATGKKTLPLKFWALENPYHGFLPHFLGKPAFTFDPWEFGDGYQKRTALWGYFNEPKKKPVPMTAEMKKLALTNSYLHKNTVKFDYMKSKDIHPEKFGVFDRQTRRSITPAGFAKAFFEANQ